MLNHCTRFFKTGLMMFLTMITATSICSAQDWANLQRYQKANSQLPSPQAKEQRVVFMGNSITDVWATSYPAFFADNNYVGRGIGGQTTPQMLVRFRPDVIDLHPAAVVILAGTNDIAGNTGAATLEEIAGNIFSMAELARAHQIKVVLCSVLPVFDYPWKPGLQPAEKIIALNQLIAAYAAKHQLVYLDYFTAMKDERNGMQAIYSGDGVHPNQAGYEVMMPMCRAAIEKALKKKGK